MPLIALLLSLGPSIIRLAGQALGGDKQNVANTIANVVQSAAGLSPDVQSAQLNNVLSGLSPDDLAHFQDLKIRLEQIAAEREKNQLDHDAIIYTEEQKTQQTEAQYGTDYTKDTRPWIARRSAVVGFVYVLTMEAAKLIGTAWGMPLPGADTYIAGMLFSPALTYMGMRTLDAFSKWKNSNNKIDKGWQ